VTVDHQSAAFELPSLERGNVTFSANVVAPLVTMYGSSFSSEVSPIPLTATISSTVRKGPLA